MAKDQSRRNFIRTAPLAAAAVSLALTEKPLLASTAPAVPAQAPEPGSRDPFQFFSAQELTSLVHSLEMNSGTKQLSGSKTTPFTIVFNAETKKSAKEFEYHEHRDHIFQVLDGTTEYELGGTPENPRSTGPGEWLAPTSKGSTSVTLHKGDMLLVPRGTPHKRITKESVSLSLISIQDVT
jgi:mannose-6-phosphate isomerase-like protein (cupin superfamily)